jgi:hypothetical protein
LVLDQMKESNVWKTQEKELEKWQKVNTVFVTYMKNGQKKLKTW